MHSVPDPDDDGSDDRHISLGERVRRLEAWRQDVKEILEKTVPLSRYSLLEKFVILFAGTTLTFLFGIALATFNGGGPLK